MSTPKKQRYVLDTNILINFGLFAPISFNKSFWNRLEALLDSGDWILLDVVVGEIKYNNDLIAWCKKQKVDGRVTSIDDSHKLRAIAINNQYKMIDTKTFKSEVDTFIIAYAEDKKLTIFTREGYKDPLDPKALYKIPDVCKLLKVRFERLPEMFLKNIGY